MSSDVETGRIIITTVLTDAGLEHNVATDGDADCLMTALGMLRLAEDSLIRRGMADDEP